MGQFTGQYKIRVVFFREAYDDLHIAQKAFPGLQERDQLIQQFRRELQQSYDAGDIAGSFDITAIENCSAAPDEEEEEEDA